MELKGLGVGVSLFRGSARIDFEPCFLAARGLRLEVSGFGAPGPLVQGSRLGEL